MHSKAALTVLASIAASGALALPAPVPRSHGLQARADAAQDGKSGAATNNWVATTDYGNPAHNPYPQVNGYAAKTPDDKYSYYYPPHGGSDSSPVSPNIFLPVTANPKNPEDQYLPGHGPTYGNRVPLYNTAYPHQGRSSGQGPTSGDRIPLYNTAYPPQGRSSGTSGDRIPLYNTAYPHDNACQNGCGGVSCPCPLYPTPEYPDSNNHNCQNGCGGDACPCPTYITPSYQEPNNHNTHNIPSVPQGAGLGPGGPTGEDQNSKDLWYCHNVGCGRDACPCPTYITPSQHARRDDHCGYAGDKFCDRPNYGGGSHDDDEGGHDEGGHDDGGF